MLHVIRKVFSFSIKSVCYAAGIVLFFLTAIASIWVLLLIIFTFIPNGALDPPLHSIAQNYFGPAQRALGLAQRYDIRVQQMDGPIATAENWVQGCFPRPDRDKELNPTELTHLTFQRKVEAQAEGVNFYLDSYKNELVRMKRLASAFAAVLIILGMTTTIVSALNSSELGTGSGRTATIIKVTAIVLPALGTMVTAFAALYASTDQAARKAQLVYNLSALSTEMNEAYLSAVCPVTADTNLSDMETRLVSWSRRLSEIVANAEYSSGQSKAPPADVEKK
ncbi:hypothetical protein HFN78_14270 [Rhizobium laguerreae]|uniref:hypothetical protein n=1 Tax=Rhizobium laguerreae TaxID=1076926 RepID=UPI001C9162DE|nr:hypothetical protein [Rhizobium laguerreae]MBY3472084.1 hypothetical protein [Rhizobium laguerreae]